MLRGELEDYIATFNTCWKCRLCSFGDAAKRRMCPAVERYGFFAYSGGGKSHIGKALVDGVMNLSGDVADVVYRCTTCGACETYCENEYYIANKFIDQVKLTEFLRHKLVEAGFGPMPKHKELVKWAGKEHNPYVNELHANRLKWLPDRSIASKKAKTAFFVGCTGAYRDSKPPASMLEIMKAAGEDVAVLSDEWCCGSPFLRVGVRDLAEEMVMHNVEVLKKMGVEKVIAHCPGCYKTLAFDYPEIAGDLPFKVVHSTQYVNDLLKSGKLKPKKKADKKVTYHDPCHIGRAAGIYEEPREILRAIGAELSEMGRNRKDAWCCGAGGGVKSAFNDFALWTAKDRVEEAKKTGAKVLVSACPFCEVNLKDAMKELQNGMEVVDLMEVVAGLL